MSVLIEHRVKSQHGVASPHQMTISINVKDYNKEDIENLEQKLIDISHEVKSPFSNKKELKEEYMKTLNEWENKKYKSSQKAKKSGKKWGKVAENGAKIYPE